MSGYFAELERELVRAAARVPRARRSRRGVALLAAALIAAAGVPAAAAIREAFRPHRDIDGVLRLTERRTIAQGSDSDGHEWRLLGSQSSAGFCLAMAMPSGDPDELAPGLGESCGEEKLGTFSLGLSSTSGRRAGLVHGVTPDEAERVEVRAGRVTVTVRTIDDSMGLKGRFYVAELPVRLLRGHMRAIALDSDGRRVRSASR